MPPLKPVKKKKPVNKVVLSMRSVKELDKALYSFLSLTHDLKLISKKAFDHACTAETKLFGDNP